MDFSKPGDLLDTALAVAVVLSTLLTVILLTLPTQYKAQSPSLSPSSSLEGKKKSELSDNAHGKAGKEVSVQVVVLGDIGRSPRMQNHAISIAKHGGRVDIIGYHESDMHPKLSGNPLVNIIAIPAVPTALQTSSKLMFVLYAPLKVLWQVWCLYYALGYISRPSKWMLVQLFNHGLEFLSLSLSFWSTRTVHCKTVTTIRKNMNQLLLPPFVHKVYLLRGIDFRQNPPSIPTLLLAQVVCFLRNTRLVIDWHNFGYSILALKLGSGHFLVKISEAYEYLCSRYAWGHVTVTEAMARTLKQHYKVNAATLHDRPPDHFKPLSSEARYSFLARLSQTQPFAPEMKAASRKLIVSSTSWTPDEDFSILLDALVAYSGQVDINPGLPRILAIITGKGPQKAYYESRIQSLRQSKKLDHVQILTAWLSMEDYASLLGAADLGVSLHTSSSGVDLPMKVVDMFGTGLPVVGWSKFEAWPELVREGVNGRGFGSADELRGILLELLGGDGSSLQKLREGALLETKRRWDDEWDPVAGRILGLVE